MNSEPRMVPANQSQTQRWLIESDEPGKITFENRDAVAMRFLDHIDYRKILMQPLSFRVLHLFLANLDPSLLPTNQIIARVSLWFLQEKTGKCKGHISRAIAELTELNILQRINHGNWSTPPTFELTLPPEATHRMRPFKQKRGGRVAPAQPLQRTGALGTERTGAVGTERTGARRGVAPAQLSNPSTEVFSSSSGEEDRGDSSAAEKLIRKRLGRETADRLLALNATTLLVVTAAGYEASTKGDEVKTAGLFAWLIEDPSRITKRFLDRAARELERRRPAPPATSPEAASMAADPDVQLTPEMIAGLKAKIAEAQHVG